MSALESRHKAAALATLEKVDLMHLLQLQTKLDLALKMKKTSEREHALMTEWISMTIAKKSLAEAKA